MDDATAAFLGLAGAAGWREQQVPEIAQRRSNQGPLCKPAWFPWTSNVWKSAESAAKMYIDGSKDFHINRESFLARL